jgi:diguanylate cyclase (GGDEF)-like protein/PAS domain S-box-containing protein
LGELSLDQLRSIIAASPVAIYTVTPDDVVTSWNPASERLFGWRADDVLGRPLPIVPSEAQAAHDALRREVLAGEPRLGLDLQRLTRAGTRIDVNMAFAPMRDERGVIVGLTGLAQDMSERVRAAQRERAQLHQLQCILDAIPAPIFYKDADGVYSGCNEAFTHYLGRSREQIVGMTVYDVAPKDLADIYRKADLDLFASRGVQIYESSVLYADGTRHDVIFNKACFLDERGKLGGLVGTILDITPRKQAERALRASEERYRAVVSALEEGIVVVSSEGKVVACNAAAERIFAMPVEDMQRHLSATSGWWVEGDDGTPTPATSLPLLKTLASGEPDSATALAFDRPDGRRVWVSMNARALFHPGETRPFAVVISFADISERRQAHERLQNLAFHDNLTGLPNRALFIDRLGHALAVAARTGEPLAVACIDLDRFKLVNDTLGHDAGDRLLCDVAARLALAARHSDTIARMGGDEFMAILPGIADPTQAEAAARRILEALRAAFALDGQEVRVAASVGMTLCPRDGQDVGTLMRNADRAMYRAKQAGDGGFCLWSVEQEERAPSRLELESRLHHALERDELALEYQPQVELASGRAVVLEALLRWRSPELGLVMPGQLIPVAEETGLMLAIGDWVLEQACRHMAAWIAEGHPPRRVAVNVSQRQWRQGEFVTSVRRALESSQLPPRWLELELTESMVMQDVDATIPRLAQLRALGVSIALDDFGVGYSSLIGLRRLPLDTLKLARSFLHDLDGDGTLPVLQSVMALARSLGVSVVAEGVETSEQLERLRALGCDRVQGFVIARPAPHLI